MIVVLDYSHVGEKTVSLLHQYFLLFSQFALLNVYAVLLCQPSQCLRVGHLFMLHQEDNGIAALATSKTLEDLA